jgi:hypothetical protein
VNLIVIIIISPITALENGESKAVNRPIILQPLRSDDFTNIRGPGIKPAASDTCSCFGRMQCQQDALICVLEEATVYTSDLKLLRPGNWLNDSICSFQLQFMQHHTFSQHKDEILFLTPGSAFVLFHEDGARAFPLNNFLSSNCQM